MNEYVFDIEADGFLATVTKVHCIAIIALDGSNHQSFGPLDLDRCLDILSGADVLVAHNGLTYDLPVLKKVLGWTPKPGTRIIDTLVAARLKHGNLKNEDFESKKVPGKLIGSHSL